MIYKTSLDNVSKGISIGIGILYASILYGHFTSIPQIGWFPPVLLAVVLGGSYLLAFLYKPLHYEMRDDVLMVHRLLKDVIILRTSIVSIEVLDKEKLNATIRLFGVGGLFGYYGKFRNKQLGTMTWYATRRDHAVLVKTNEGKKIVLTPDDPTGFIASFK